MGESYPRVLPDIAVQPRGNLLPRGFPDRGTAFRPRSFEIPGKPTGKLEVRGRVVFLRQIRKFPPFSVALSRKCQGFQLPMPDRCAKFGRRGSCQITPDALLFS